MKEVYCDYCETLIPNYFPEQPEMEVGFEHKGRIYCETCYIEITEAEHESGVNYREDV